MNIKSNLNKPILGFKHLNGTMVLVATLFGIILSAVAISVGYDTPAKVIFILFGLLISAMVVDFNFKDVQFKKNIIVVVLTIFIMEIGLFMASPKVTHERLKPMITKEVKLVKEEKLFRDKTKKVTVHMFSLYSYDSSSTVLREEIDMTHTDKVEFMMSITGRETYIDYIPFFKYKEKTRYTRGEQK